MWWCRVKWWLYRPAFSLSEVQPLRREGMKSPGSTSICTVHIHFNDVYLHSWMQQQAAIKSHSDRAGTACMPGQRIMINQTGCWIMKSSCCHVSRLFIRKRESLQNFFHFPWTICYLSSLEPLQNVSQNTVVPLIEPKSSQQWPCCVIVISDEFSSIEGEDSDWLSMTLVVRSGSPTVAQNEVNVHSSSP